MPTNTAKPQLAEVLASTIDAPDDELHRWLHNDEAASPLPEARAALDEAFTRGYAHGVEVMIEDTVDRFRTVLLRMLEVKFGVIDNVFIDRIADANQKTLERWCVTALEAHIIEEALPEHARVTDSRH